MAEQKNEVQVTFSDLLTNKLISIEESLPKTFNRDRFVQNAISVITEKPELQKVNRNQLMLGLVKGAMMNLDYSNREFYLIAYGSSVNFQFDYRGLQKVVKQYSIRPIKDIRSDIVREGDEFQISIIDNKQVINFKPKPFSDAEIVGVFAWIEYSDGEVICERMSVKEINDVRNNYSKQANGNSWKKSWSEMARKTVIRRLIKTVDISFENVEARKIFDEESDADFTIKRDRSDEIVDVFSKDNKEKDLVIIDDVKEGE